MEYIKNTTRGGYYEWCFMGEKVEKSAYLIVKSINEMTAAFSLKDI